MYLLIDTLNSKLITRCESGEVLCEHAEDLDLDAYSIGPIDNAKAFSLSLNMDLCDSVAERYHAPLPELKGKGALLNAVQHILTLAEKHTPIIKAEPLPPLPPEPRPAAPRHAAPASGPPKSGVTKQVWDIADQLKNKFPQGKELRKQVIEACVTAGINTSTASTQYGRWRKYQLIN